MVKYYGYHVQIPFLVGMNLYSDNDSAFYWGIGLTASLAAFYREVRAQQQTYIVISENEVKALENQNYERSGQCG